MNKKNKLILALTIAFICVFNVISYANELNEENAENEIVNNVNNEISENNEINNENNNEITNETGKDNKGDNESKIDEGVESPKVQEDKKKIKSKNISFNYAHKGKMKSAQYLKKKANANSKKIIYIKKSKKVIILGEKSNFYKIEYKKGNKKYTGYIKKKFINLNTNITVAEGNEKKLKPTITPKNSTDKIKFTTSDKKIAIVDSSGKIKAIKSGEVKITATTESGKKDYVIVKVEKKSIVPKGTMRLNKKAAAMSVIHDNVERVVYGKSIRGENLEAYIIKGAGNNSKVMFIEAAVHGFEDEYPKDAKVLVSLANTLVEYYANNPKKLKDYTCIIVPCVNPDGTLYGKNNYRANKKKAFGRCTYKGVDLNRDFDETKFKSKESRALKKLMKKYSDKIKVNLDLHGWEDSVLGDKKLVKTIRKYVGNKKDKSGKYGGKNNFFLINYTKKELKAHSALIEFKNSKSVKPKNVEKAINAIVDIY